MGQFKLILITYCSIIQHKAVERIMIIDVDNLYSISQVLNILKYFNTTINVDTEFRTSENKRVITLHNEYGCIIN